MSRTSNSIKNVNISIFTRCLELILGFVARKIFVVFLGAEYLGLNGLFSNILSVLSLVELGAGSAIIFSMYKPLAEGDREKVKALMSLYKRTYFGIGAFVGVAGCAITPLLPVLIQELPQIQDIYLIYILFVLNSAGSYFFSYKRSIINADQRRYVSALNHTVFFVLCTLVQIGILLITSNYILYLFIQIVFTLLENISISRRANKLYPYLKETVNTPLNPEDMRTIKRNVSAMMFHKIGGVVVNGTDNLLIARFVGIVSVGLYSNYLLVVNAIKTLTALMFTSITASIGNLNIEADAVHKKMVFQRMFFFSGWLFGFCSVSLMCLTSPFIALCFGREYLLTTPVVFLIVLNFYMYGMRQPVLVTRNAIGLFWNDRYKPIFESLINLVVSILLAVKIGLAGILIGTLVSTLTTCFWVEPYVLYRHGLAGGLAHYFKQYCLYTIATTVALVVTWTICSLLPGTGFGSFMGKAAICAVVPNLIYLVSFHKMEEFHYFIQLFKGLIWNRS